MIRFVIGHPGAGKTLFLVTKIIEELVYTDRFVITNISELKLGRLGEYIADKHPRRDPPVDLDARLLIIPKDETFRFWRYRSGGLILEDSNWQKMSLEESFKKLTALYLGIAARPEWMQPVSYFLSEAHEFFPAKDWQEIARPVKFYASKHRHLHDEVIVETQFPEQVEPNFRRLAQEFHRLRNFYTMSFGPFAQRGHFERKVYLQLPSASSVAVESASFQLDAKGIATCYETTGGLGIMNRGPEQKGFGRRRKLPWWTVYAGAAALLVLVVYGLYLAPKVVEKAIAGVMGGAQKGINASISGGSSAAVMEGGARRPAARGDQLAPVEVVGYAVIQGGVPRVWLSDGRLLTEHNGIAEIRADEVVMQDGKRYPVRGGRGGPSGQGPSVKGPG